MYFSYLFIGFDGALNIKKGSCLFSAIGSRHSPRSARVLAEFERHSVQRKMLHAKFALI